MVNTQQGFPGVPGAAMVGPDGIPTQGWYSFFLNLWQRTGGANGGASAILDQITNVVGSMLYRATGGWSGLAPGAQYRVLRMGVAVPEWDVLDGNSFGSQTANKVLASPNGSSGTPSFRAIVGADFGSQTANEFLVAPNGSSGNPTFRTLATADLDSTAGQYPGTSTNDNASVGNIGEYIFSQINSGSAVSLSNGVTKDITSIPLTPGDYDVWGLLSTLPAAGTTQSDIRGWVNTVSATDPGPPNNGCYAELQTSIAAGLGQTLSLNFQRISVPIGGNAYLSANVTFATSTLAAYGFIGARRRR